MGETDSEPVGQRDTQVQRRTRAARCTHPVAALVGLAVLGLAAADASAVYHPTLGRFLQRDPGPGAESPARAGPPGPAAVGHLAQLNVVTRYVDGMNLYEYVKSSPAGRVDPDGCLSAPAAGGRCCPWVLNPWKCRIEVQWKNKLGGKPRAEADHYPTNSVNKYQLLFQVYATVTLVHSEGKSVEGCYLQQDYRDITTWGGELETEGDYSIDDVGKSAYHEWWFIDAPGVARGYRERPKVPQAIWVQLHVYVVGIHPALLQTWWGYAGTAYWDAQNKGHTGIATWSGAEKLPFSVLPGVVWLD